MGMTLNYINNIIITIYLIDKDPLEALVLGVEHWKCAAHLRKM
jgi:hypothetical protein